MRKTKNKQDEYYHQCCVVQWANNSIKKYPDLYFLNASLMGVKISMFQQLKAKKMGCKRSWPDLFLSCIRGGYAGLYIEMKAPDGRLRGDQREVLEKLKDNGYKAVTAFGATEAIDYLVNYLEGKYER